MTPSCDSIDGSSCDQVMFELMLGEMLTVPSGVDGFSCAREGWEVTDADDEDMH